MSGQEQILIVKTLDQELLDNGYAVFPFLNKEEIETLVSFFNETHKEVPEGLYATAHVADTDFRNQMNDKIKQVFKRANDATFGSAINALGGTFMVKSPGPAGKLVPHQDWSIVDERYHRSFNVWVPLVDVGPENGSLQVLSKSHTFVDVFRGPNTPSAFSATTDKSWAQMKTIEIPAGHAVIYDHRLLHASEENTGTENRLVVVYGVIPKDAEMRYYYVEDDKVFEYECNPDFFMYGNPGAGPRELKKLREVDAKFEQWGVEPTQDLPIGFFEKIKKMLFKNV